MNKLLVGLLGVVIEELVRHWVRERLSRNESESPETSTESGVPYLHLVN